MGKLMLQPHVCMYIYDKLKHAYSEVCLLKYINEEVVIQKCIMFQMIFFKLVLANG